MTDFITFFLPATSSFVFLEEKNKTIMLPSNQPGFAGPHLAVPQLYWSQSLFWPPHAFVFRWSQASVRKILTLCVVFFKIFSSLLRCNLQENQNLISLLLLMFMLGNLFPSSSHAGTQQEFLGFFLNFSFFFQLKYKETISNLYFIV